MEGRILARHKMMRRRITVQQKTRPEVSEVNSIMQTIQARIQQLGVSADCIFFADETGVNYAAGACVCAFFKHLVLF